MKIIVAGGRDFPVVWKYIKWTCEMLSSLGCTEVLSGGAEGADLIGEMAAERIGIACTIFKAQWEKYGKSAGPLRNLDMALHADKCILFPGGKGTANMKICAEKHGLDIIEYGGGPGEQV